MARLSAGYHCVTYSCSEAVMHHASLTIIHNQLLKDISTQKFKHVLEICLFLSYETLLLKFPSRLGTVLVFREANTCAKALIIVSEWSAVVGAASSVLFKTQDKMACSPGKPLFHFFTASQIVMSSQSQITQGNIVAAFPLPWSTHSLRCPWLRLHTSSPHLPQPTPSTGLALPSLTTRHTTVAS